MDWWSLGVTLAFAATGKHPFRFRWSPAKELGVPRPPWEESSESVEQANEQSPETEQHSKPCAGPAQAWPPQTSAIDLPAQHSPKDPTREQSPSAVTIQGLDEHKPRNGADGKSRKAEVYERAKGVAQHAESAAEDDGVPLSEEELNYNTLFAPLAFSAELIGKDLAGFLTMLLCRDVTQRLGSEGKDVQQHAFFEGIFDWALLSAMSLVAPFIPDPSVVYSKDSIASFSEEDETARVDKAGVFHGWDYCCSPNEYKHELKEFVQKTSTSDILRMPASLITSRS